MLEMSSNSSSSSPKVHGVDNKIKLNQIKDDISCLFGPIVKLHNFPCSALSPREKERMSQQKDKFNHNCLMVKSLSFCSVTGLCRSRRILLVVMQSITVTV